MKIYVMGLGNMGSWFARSLKQEHAVAGYDKEKSRVEKLKGEIKILNPEELESYEPDLVLNAVTLKDTIEAFESIDPFIKGHTILCDIASVKGDIQGYYKKKGLRFLSMHPMFGPTFANMEKLKGENVIFISGSDKEAVNTLKRFFKKYRLKFFELSFEEHDRMMAYSLAVPFISSLVFASCVEKTVVPGTTFSKHLSIARGLLSEDDHLLGEILFNTHTLPEVEKITGRLEYLKHIIKQKDQEELLGLLSRLRRNIG
jgi:prephenate dehydrogenase